MIYAGCKYYKHGGLQLATMYDTHGDHNAVSFNILNVLKTLRVKAIFSCTCTVRGDRPFFWRDYKLSKQRTKYIIQVSLFAKEHNKKMSKCPSSKINNILKEVIKNCVSKIQVHPLNKQVCNLSCIAYCKYLTDFRSNFIYFLK